MSLHQNKFIDVWHLDNYIKCPAFAKYDWNNKSLRGHHYLYHPIRNILLGCYRDLANLEKKIVWKTVRERVHKNLAPLLKTDIEIEDYKRIAIQVMSQIRSWYINSFRDGPEICLHNLKVNSLVPATGISIEAQIDAVLVSSDQVRIVEITDKYEDLREASLSLSLQAKAWLLSKQDVKVTEIELINISNKSFTNRVFRIREKALLGTERSLQWTIGGIKHKVFHPSVTQMCTTCPYRSICS